MRIFDKSRHQSLASYARYQEEITTRHLLPLFRSKLVPLERPILDVGCGTGGCSMALAEALSVPVYGVDIDEDAIAAARESAEGAAVRVCFSVRDVLRDELPPKTYGLILMRDIVEHLGDVQEALERLRLKLDPDGFLYVSFPPWAGPYAGHQHSAKSAVRFMPYLHVIAPSVFLNLLHAWEPTQYAWLAEMRQIAANRLTMRKFEQLLRHSGWKIAYRKTYFLRPAFLRMGLPKVSNGWLGRLPLIGESISTGCEYLLRPT